MAKFYDYVGFVSQVETSPGIFENQIIKRKYRGDIVRNVGKYQAGENLNDDLTIDNKISIIADSFAYNNTYSMKFIYFMGSFWKITSIDVQRPRLILSIGGVYNGRTD